VMFLLLSLSLCLSLCQILLLFSQKQSDESRVALISRVTQRRCLAGWHDVRILIILKCHFTRRSRFLSRTSALDYCELDVFRLPESQPAYYHSHSLLAENARRVVVVLFQSCPFSAILNTGDYKCLKCCWCLFDQNGKLARDLKFESHQTGIRASRNNHQR
jgi:hypothetical protein